MNRSRIVMASLLGLATAAPAAALTPPPRVNADHHFAAVLSGAQEVPPVEAPGVATLTIDFDEALANANFSGTVTWANPLTGAHLHCAPAGVNGPIVASLFQSASAGSAAATAPPEPTTGSGQISVNLAGTLTHADIVAPAGEEAAACTMAITNIASLYAAARAGLLYVNVHTTENPQGEMRAQLFFRPCPDALYPGSVPPVFGATPPGAETVPAGSGLPGGPAT